MMRLDEQGPEQWKLDEQQTLLNFEDEDPNDPCPKRYKINEMFYSIQGEGVDAGSAAVFIRFSVCNLACTWCDTEYSSGVKVTAETIRRRAVSLWRSFKPNQVPIIVCTGGEPSLQVDVGFVNAMKENGHRLTMETNGVKWKPSMHMFDLITVSPKTASGWWAETHLPEAKKTSLKLVYDPTNPEWDAIWLNAQHMNVSRKFIQPLTSPHTGESNAKHCADLVRSFPGWKLSIQTHKIIGVR